MPSSFQSRMEAVDIQFSRFDKLETLQVNLGDLCNLSCAHCHHNASPLGAKIMGRAVMDAIAAFLARWTGLALDITGGCPEMNPDFLYFIETTAGLAGRRIIRSNLAIALEEGMEWLPEFYSRHGLVVMASLPCYLSGNVDNQRGAGVFGRSIEVLRRLNSLGYGHELELHLVHNPGSGSVYGPQTVLAQDYQRELSERFGIRFSRLHCMNNSPLGRFREDLEKKGTYRRYVEHLAERFNPAAAERIMCRTLISVGWDGTLYNCDFNLAAGLPLLGADGAELAMERIDEALVRGREIRTAEHCFSCTAGEGSGCGGSLPASDFIAPVSSYSQEWEGEQPCGN
ncbi:MAG TPA: arsenosugar biosynthesis radical SAM (seleno)protein ArsS [Geobacteraceae bacterium]